MRGYLLALLLLYPAVARPYLIWDRDSKFREAAIILNCKTCNATALAAAKPIVTELEMDQYQRANPYFSFVLGKFYKETGRLEEINGDTKDAKINYTASLENFKSYLDGLSTDDTAILKTAVLAVGYAYFHLGDFNDGLALLDKYQSNFDEQDGDVLLCIASLYNGLGYSLFRSDHMREATQDFEKAFQARPRGYPMFANNLINALLLQTEKSKSPAERHIFLDRASTVLKTYEGKSYWDRDPKFRATGRELHRVLNAPKSSQSS